MKKIFSLLMVFVIFLASVNTKTVKAEALNDGSAPSCYPLDVIFVVDQSGSMSDPIYATDPTNQRETAVEAMTDWLSENVLDVCPGVRHQVGVVSFGSTARVDLPLTEIAPTSFQELRALENQLHDKIVADNLGNTIPLNAFKLIPDMFKDSQIKSGGPRKQVVIYLTDGVIDYGDGTNHGLGYTGATSALVNYINTNFPFDPTLLKREQCITFQIQAYGKFENVPYEKMNECMQKNAVDDSAYSKSIYLYTILMNYGQSWPKAIKALYVDAVQKHAGEVMDFYEAGQSNRQAIPTYFQQVFSRLSGLPSGQVQCGGVAVNPYLEKAVFVFYKFSPDTKVSLRYKDAQGNMHQIVGGQSDTGGFNVEDYQAYGTNERYIFTKPYPGIWFIESDRCANGGINAFYQEVQVNPGGFTLSLPPLAKHDIAPYYDQSAPVYLSYQMYNSAGDLIVDSDQPIFKVDAQATVTDPIGKKIVYPLKWDSEKQLFQASDALQVPLPGEYDVSIIGTTKVHKGDTSGVTEDLAKTFNTDNVLFHHDNLKFTVRDVKPFVMTSLRPTQDKALPQIHGTIFQGWPLPVVPIPVRVQLSLRNAPLDVPLKEILTDPNNAITAWVTNGEGTASEPVILRTDPQVVGQFAGNIPWSGTETQLTLHVKISGDYSTAYEPDNREIQIPFTRQDALPFYRAGFYIFLLILIIVLIILWIVYYIWMHTDPVRGKLVIQTNSVPVRTDELFTGKRITKFTYSHDDGVDLGKIYVRYMPKVKTSEDDQDAPREIKIWGQTEHKTKISIEGLAPGTSASYCTEHIEYSFLFEGEK